MKTTHYKLEGAFLEQVLNSMMQTGMSRENAEIVAAIAAGFPERIQQMFEREMVFAAIDAGEDVEEGFYAKYFHNADDRVDIAINPKRELFDDIAEILYPQKAWEDNELRQMIVPLLNVLEPLAIAAAKRV